MQQTSIIAEYLEIVRQQIRWKKIQSSLLEEINNHIDDQISAFINDGLDEEEATKKAIADMGNPVVVGKRLDHTHRPNLVGIGLGLIIILSVLGSADMGNSLLRIIGFGDQIVLGIFVPRLAELVYLIGMFVIESSFAFIYASTNVSKAVIYCQGFIVTAVYLSEVFPRIRFVLLLVAVNIICFLVLYRITRSIKFGLVWTVTSFSGLFIFVLGTQFNCYMYNHLVNGNYGGFENVPKALAAIALMCLVPQVFMAFLIRMRNSKVQIV
ncbi:permease prefix domain 1-containing protein [Desulfosporosinus sp. SYSU MS00001]|uniref:permease prefix domain 1-containing protein n=1 Tax=Desulfosporosinus sp. SYSU MS00001 TaxID=3416284 RepID=UPI003CF5E38B